MSALPTQDGRLAETSLRLRPGEAVTAPDHEQAERLDRIDWYRRCLEDLHDGRVVRGLDEAKTGYDSAMEELRDLAAQLAEREREIEELRKALEWIAANVREPRMQLEAESALESLRSDSEESG